MLKYIRLALILIGMGFAVSLWSSTPVVDNMQTYAYKYIIALFEAGDTQHLNQEIQSFYTKYPQSPYYSIVKVIEASMLMSDGELNAALALFDELLTADLSLPLRNQVYLKRAITLYHLDRWVDAIEQIQILESESKEPALMGEANLYKARLYRKLGQYFSAQTAYQNALKAYQEDPDLVNRNIDLVNEIQFEFFEVQVRLENEKNALGYLSSLDSEHPNFIPCYALWAEYLLDNERYTDFDNLLQRNPTLLENPNIKLSRLRKAFLVDDMEPVASLLESATTPNMIYYKALYALKQNETTLADSLFSELVKTADAELKVLSYLERLKILYQTEPVAAMLQLGNFLQNSSNTIARSKQLLTMAYFAYQKLDYVEALKHLSVARNETKNRQEMSEIDILIAKSWLRAKRNTNATEAFNRYLNLYPNGKDRDTALYYLGVIYFEAKDYALAKSSFTQLIDVYGQSAHVPSAKFYLAEMDFFLANYNLALSGFLEIAQREPENEDAALRLAQIYYYMGDYDKADEFLGKLSPSYDSLILQGHINFIRRNYTTALEYFSLSERATQIQTRITEAQSYKALCLFQMKRYAEASELYLKLFKGKESPDTFLYLSGKSAYAAGAYHQALKLFDQFIDTYPESQYYLPVLADIANSYYNMGNYPQAVQDYSNILMRYRNVRDFTEADKAILKEIFTGLELALLRADNPLLVNQLAEMSGTFNSLYITFEVSYILLKVYTADQKWTDVLTKAEMLRQSFPEQNRAEVELLMAQSLINLNEIDRADSLLSSLYNDTEDTNALLQWAEIDMLHNQYSAAIQKYRQAFSKEPKADTWFKMLTASVAGGYQDFEELWYLGSSFQNEVGAARLLRLAQLTYDKQYEEANTLAEAIIQESLSNYEHANAFMYKAIALYQQEKYDLAIQDFKSVMMLFPDFSDVNDNSAYYIVKSYLQMGARAEAEMHLWNLAPKIGETNMRVLNSLMEDKQ